jgi:hypothetical protein
LAAPKSAKKNVEAARSKIVPDKEQKNLQQNSATILPPPAITPQSGRTNREKIEEILKKGL